MKKIDIKHIYMEIMQIANKKQQEKKIKELLTIYFN